MMTDPVHLIGESPAMSAVLEKLDRLALMDAKASVPCNVVIHGETGTGKDLVARRIHEKSGRGDQAFVAVNCSAVPGELFESELFGHERGAFTSAYVQKKGLLEQARGGTLFLDEAADLPIGLQVKLLRALQNRVVRRVGGLKDIDIDVRVIVASNRDLAALVEREEIRSDLYYRLNVFSVTLPPLRERREDVPALVGHFCNEHAAKYGVSRKEVTVEVMAAFLRYAWPGNVRELEHVLEYAYIVSPGDEIRLEDLVEKFGPIPSASSREREAQLAMAPDQAREELFRWVAALPDGVTMPTVSTLFREAKRHLCLQRLEQTGGNIAAAARAVELDRRSFYRLTRESPANGADDADD
jgi:DNA-binding NtrC family response regulator